MKPFTFQPVSFSWVALHPQPQGVVQFIGGAFFGSFPTLSYRHLLHEIYNAGYTVVAMPFRFSFRHWGIALSLLEEQRRLQAYLPELAAQAGYEAEVYQQSDRYAWLGHSLGCKYIALLELLCGVELNPLDTTLDEVIGVENAHWLRDRLATAPVIWNQPTLLLAPDISDTTSAVPLKTVAHLLNKLGLGVQPTRQQTLDLIDRSRLFNLTAMVSFSRDTVAGSITDPCPAASDVGWLYRHLQTKKLIHTELGGKHLEPLGVNVGPWLVDLNPFDKFAKPLLSWSTGETVVKFLHQLQHRIIESTIPKPTIPVNLPEPSLAKR
ncbi:DUF1350 family protein [Nodosilinea sp. LEGE 06152]|uniref:DUF1350 family protein n=1 Tax=Nodosilinea sp. LEGE 06152 TaxID=2777966 RepID=UPI00187FE2CE|nr:DUF1350 family protein [Nodosilinea sp. LEGE 06152]MBE9158458.1 DUF1350 family protein [Nodosilinea sp. LEGE 06152]